MLSKTQVCFGILIFLIHCQVSLRVYRTHPQEPYYDYVETLPNVEIKVENETLNQMAIYDGYFVDEEPLQNEYGPLSYLIRKELTLRKTRYSKYIQSRSKITIEDFSLVSKDTCFSNTTSVLLKAKIEQGNKIPKDYLYEDKIESSVSNCTWIFSPIIFLWYGPYIGFRGNREDQLNQLGRNALDDFFQFLEAEAPPKTSTPIPTKATDAKDRTIDPKLKEIIESL